MKNLLFIPAFLLAITCNAQYYISQVANGNPNNINQEDFEYPPGGGLPSGWTSILAGGQNSPTWSPSQTIPFTFKFNDTAVTSFKASSSGVVTFNTGSTSGAPSHNNGSLPSNAVPNKSVCVWGVSGKGSNDAIVTKAFGSAPNRQLWISYNNYSEASIFVNHYTYFSIVLEENSNRIYIVDQRNFGATPSLTLGLQINASEAYQVAGSPNYNPLAGNSATRTDNKYYGFIPGTQVTNDGFLKKLVLRDDMLLSSAPYTVDVTLENTGIDTIHSAELTVSINGNAATTINTTNLNIPPNGLSTFTLLNNWNPNTAATYNIKTWIKTINTVADQNNQNDTLVKTVNLYGNEHQRIALVETFTSSTSPTSKTANDQVETLLNNNVGYVTSLKYQMNGPGTGDPYFTSEALTRNQYYSIQAVNSLMLDGKNQLYSQQLNQDTLDENLEDVAFIDLDATYWVNGKTVNINVDINPLETFAGQNYVLQAAIFETITTQNAKTSGETEFFHVMKKMVPNANGTLLGGLNKANSVTQNLSYQFNGNFRLPGNANNQINHATEHSVEEFSDLGVVVWVQDNDTKEILQSAYAVNTISIDELEKNSVVLFPNPAKEYVKIGFAQNTASAEVSIFSIDGKKVHHSAEKPLSNELELNTSQLLPGLYVIEINSNGNNAVEKLIIE